CYVIGDKATDLEVAEKVLAKAILVKTGYGSGEVLYNKKNWKTRPLKICVNLFEAVNFILEREL
ncbi:MAG: HAD hydrolase-like protein, partial [Acidobacteria bacterium]|nr:HAD hydrolase-like protein [Acidobacteriota bacterium]